MASAPRNIGANWNEDDWNPPQNACQDQVPIEPGWDRAVHIDNADLTDAKANHQRKQLLSYRAFLSRKYLFAGFPNDVKWRRVELHFTELGLLKYGKFPAWIKLSGKNRRVIDAARGIDKASTTGDAELTEAVRHTRAVAEQVKLGRRFPDLIAAQGSGNDLILIEGHARATAYVLAQRLESVQVLVGTSTQMNQRAFF